MTDTVTVHARISLSAETLAAVVKHSKRCAREQGGKPDPAETLNQMLTRFLSEKDFESYVEDPENYGQA